MSSESIGRQNNESTQSQYEALMEGTEEAVPTTVKEKWDAVIDRCLQLSKERKGISFKIDRDRANGLRNRALHAGKRRNVRLGSMYLRGSERLILFVRS
jgi:hypothetical protein